jgi:hypothetical protein
MTKEELITKIQELQQSNPEREITRAFFRKETGIQDSLYEKLFGTFTQFKSSAGLAYSKVQKKILSSINSHASVEQRGILTTEKSNWGEAYLKPSDNRFQSILCGSDLHDKLCDPFYRRLFILTAARLQPEKIVLAGDIFDFYEFSKYTKDPRKVDILSAINWVHDFLRDLRGSCPNSEIILIEGNHEHRLLTYLSESAPHIMPILSDLHGFTVSSLLGLDTYEVNYISKSDLRVFKETDVHKEITKNYYIAYDAVLFHHFPVAAKYGLPGVNGHHHTHKVEHHFTIDRGPYEWHQLGCGHIRNAEYCEGEKWSNGFAIIHVDTHSKRVQFEYIDTTSNFCVIGGKFYTRAEVEIVKYK